MHSGNKCYIDDRYNIKFRAVSRKEGVCSFTLLIEISHIFQRKMVIFHINKQGKLSRTLIQRICSMYPRFSNPRCNPGICCVVIDHLMKCSYHLSNKLAENVI